jgi:hypothetical protein
MEKFIDSAEFDAAVEDLFTNRAFRERDRFIIRATDIRSEWDCGNDDLYYSALRQGLISFD